MDLKNSRLKSCWRRQVLRRRFAEDVDLEKPVSSRLLDLRAARKARENNSSNVSTPDSGFGDEDYQRPTIEQSLSKPESDFEKTTTGNKSSSPVNAPAVDIWKMIQERKPEHKTSKIENGKDNSEQLKGLEQENQRLRDELANTCPKSELNELRRKLEAAESEITDLKSARLSPPRAERDESSGDGEIFSTPPSSPQPVNNLPVQSQASIDRSRLKGLESDVARLQLALDDSAAASKEAAKQFKADLSAEKSRRRETEAENDDLKRRLQASEAERKALESEFKSKSERKDDELQRLRAELDGLKKLMSDDLQVAVDSIATRGPYINIDSPLTDVESQILQAIKVQSRLHT